MRSKWIWTLLIVCGICFLLAACTAKKKGATAPGIEWLTDLNTALEHSQKTDKPLMIDFMAVWCPPCKMMEDSTFCHPDVIRKSKSFVTLRIDVDKQPDIANQYNSNAQKYGGIGIPNILFMTRDQQTIAHPIGFMPPERLASLMDSVLSVVR